MSGCCARWHPVRRRSTPSWRLGDLRETPAGTIRITAHDHPVRAVLWPALSSFLPAYPEIKVELVIDYGLTDIAAGRYDAGVRLEEMIGQDMIAVRIGPDMRTAVVGAPGYFAHQPKPQAPQDLVGHECVNLRLPTLGRLYAWEFEKDGRPLRVRVDGRLVFNASAPMLEAGRLIRVLADWCPPYAGYHLYYPSRRQPNMAFSLLVEALRYRA